MAARTAQTQVVTMTTSPFAPAALAQFGAYYPETPGLISHNLSAHPLLSLEALVSLATQLPADSVEYNPADLPIGIAPEEIPLATLGIAETIASIEHNGSWMVLKRIEQHPDYAKLLCDTLAPLAPLVAPSTGAMIGMEGFIFISSPHAVTPFHFDPEHNLLLQIRGSKTMSVFPATDARIADARAHEQFHLGMHHRNLVWNPQFADQQRDIALCPGDGVHMPVKAPHWVKVDDAVSISLSVTWRSNWSYAEADARAFNHVLRRLGLSPRDPGRYPAQNLAKSLAYRALRRLGVTGH